MIDNLIVNTVSQPIDQANHSVVLRIESPSNDLMALMATKRIELVNQLPQLRTIGVDCSVQRTGFSQVNTAPVAYRLERSIRIRLSHGHILASQLLLPANRLDRKSGSAIDAEDLFFWKVPSEVISND